MNSNDPELYHNLPEDHAIDSHETINNLNRRSTDKLINNNLKRGRRFSDQTRHIIDKILSSNNITQSIFSITNDLKNIFECERVSLFAVDRKKRQVYTKNFTTRQIDEIRLDISAKNLAGFVAATGKTLNIENAYDEKELNEYYPDLKLDKSWDESIPFNTKSVLAFPLPYNNRLIGVLQCINCKSGKKFSLNHIRNANELATTLGHAMVQLEIESIESRIKSTEYLIHSAFSIDEILLEIHQPILHLFDAQLVTIYAIDEVRNELYSIAKFEGEINKTRVPISTQSISGYVAQTKKSANIIDVYNSDELRIFHPDLKFDSSWDKKTKIQSKSMLVFPLLKENLIMGVLQLVNKNGAEQFTEYDERNAKIISNALALAIFNQQKIIRKKRTKFGLLVEKGIISQDEMNQAIKDARKKQIDLEAILLNELKIKRLELGKSIELYYSSPYLGFNDSIIIPQSNFNGFNKSYLIKNNLVPLENNDTRIVVLTDNPFDKNRIQNIQMIFPKKEIEVKVGLKIDIKEFLASAMILEKVKDHTNNDNYSEEVSSLLDALEDEIAETSSIIKQEQDETEVISESDSTIVRLINKILIDAYDQGISDIHFEPGIEKNPIKVRFRKDGLCGIYQEIPYLYKQAIISRIKIMSQLDIAERRLPQDGKIKMKYGEKDIEYRVATCPTVGGNEDAVLRILAANKPIPLDKMNFSRRNLELVKGKSNKPYGLILVVGPTGSGKTTTLHSCLGHINTPALKIWTAEDPVEITQDGLRQVQMLNKIGLDFARAMKSFLRGDPDVIMVGEMRDSETCSIGLEASLTGHLVFSTLHTNSAPETITRLLDMGMNPLNFADALLLVVAQRLVRTLCKKCKEDYHPTKEEFDSLVKEYGDGFEKLNIEYSDDLILKKPVGCSSCGDTGYAGRTGLHECLEGTNEIKRMIMKKAFVEELREQALSEGMTTLKQDGIYKIFKGDCDLKQVMAVCIV